MCDLLVHKTDRLPPGDPRHHGFHAAGDVVGVFPDGWTFGAAEIADPDLLVLGVPGLPAHEASWLLAPMWAGAGGLPRRRSFAIDLGHPAVSGKAAVTAADLAAARVMRSPLPDPRHIGHDPRVIG